MNSNLGWVLPTASRRFLLLFHRYVGLGLTGFLLLAGITGSLLAWNEELDTVVCPELMLASPPAAGAQPLDLLVLRERVLAHYPDTRVLAVPLAAEPGRSINFFLEAAPGSTGGRVHEPLDDQVFVDPYTGRILGGRKWGDIKQGMKNLMPFVYRLHYSLALGTAGSWLLGIVALAWTLDCFVGACLTFPARRRARMRAGVSPASTDATAGKTWLARWWPAWQVRWTGGSYKVNFDLHRAGGLWLWAMLFMLAWSGVAFNLPQAFSPVMHAVFAHQPDVEVTSRLARPLPEPRIGWDEARATGRALMAREARAGGFAVREELSLSYDASRALFRYRVRSDRDVRSEGGSTSLWFDANSGERRALFLPTGTAGGDTVTTWLFALHMAAVGGLPFKVFVCATGLAAALLSATGAVIWWRKRSARAKSGDMRRPALVRSARWGVSSLLTRISRAGSGWRNRLRTLVRFSRRPS